MSGMIFYEVLRKGRQHQPWRKLVETDNRERAVRVFEKEREKMRQGQVVLLADGLAQRSDFAYWLRTRW